MSCEDRNADNLLPLELPQNLQSEVYDGYGDKSRYHPRHRRHVHRVQHPILWYLAVLIQTNRTHKEKSTVTTRSHSALDERHEKDKKCKLIQASLKQNTNRTFIPMCCREFQILHSFAPPSSASIPSDPDKETTQQLNYPQTRGDLFPRAA